jgi:radical SAM superfamily enzyme YgiQ (UPF0313 family)
MRTSVDILLTHGYFLVEDEHEKRIMKPYAPLGILYISAYLKSKNFSVDVYDTTFRSKAEFREYVDHQRPAAIGIYTNLMTKLNVLEMIRFCKSKNCIVIVGGPEPAYYAEHFLRYGADVVVIGEGEQTLESLLPALNTYGVHRLHEVQGIVFLDESGGIVETNPRPFLADIDQLPFPDRDAIDMAKYVNTWKSHHGRGSVSVITARGCPYTCKWCSHGVFGFTHRRRSPANVVDEIEMIISKHHPEMLWIADDVFTINHRWLQSFAAEMNRRNLKIPFECITRADRLDNEVLTTLANLGCFRIWYGSESGSQKILDAMSRGVSVEEIQKMCHLAQRHGIEVGLFVMLGYEGETIRDIEETIAHLKKTNADVFLTTVAYPIRGTAYQKSIDADIVTDIPWERRTERELKIKGRYSDRFYWYAQRRITNEVRFHQLLHQGSSSILRMAGAYAKANLARLGMQLTKHRDSL